MIASNIKVAITNRSAQFYTDSSLHRYGYTINILGTKLHSDKTYKTHASARNASKRAIGKILSNLMDKG